MTVTSWKEVTRTTGRGRDQTPAHVTLDVTGRAAGVCSGARPGAQRRLPSACRGRKAAAGRVLQLWGSQAAPSGAPALGQRGQLTLEDDEQTRTKLFQKSMATVELLLCFLHSRTHQGVRPDLQTGQWFGDLAAHVGAQTAGHTCVYHTHQACEEHVTGITHTHSSSLQEELSGQQPVQPSQICKPQLSPGKPSPPFPPPLLLLLSLGA
ncbi:hypothetical protein WMY93_025180 [Mugilogobius chulae]|uniref:Uncharacterized protein n=1 Tax=Mugilogobius chulae TaxID=88201 RepID=A0AAW0N6M4_9GOBI